MQTNDAFSFLMAWAAAPFRIGSVTPSSATLSALMTKEVGPDTGPVLELGPGTGPFTRALIEKGVRENDLTLIEADSDFAAMLTKRFPAARIFEMDATGLRHMALYNGPVLGAAISGLPFRLISPRRTRLILEGVFANLRPGASLYQFTLGLRCPLDQTLLDQLALQRMRAACMRVAAHAHDVAHAEVEGHLQLLREQRSVAGEGHGVPVGQQPAVQVHAPGAAAFQPAQGVHEG